MWHSGDRRGVPHFVRDDGLVQLEREQDNREESEKAGIAGLKTSHYKGQEVLGGNGAVAL